MNIERVVLSNLVFREDYGRKVIPFLKSEYFLDNFEKTCFGLIEAYVQKYNSFPTQEVLQIELRNKDKIDETTYKNCKEIIEKFEFDPETNLEWLTESTEKWVQEKAVYNAIMASIQILDNQDKIKSKGSIPQLLSDALAVSFDSSIGHNWDEDSDARYEFYHRVENKIPFDLEYFNLITKGGLSNKTLNVILGGTGVGKTLVMCHFAASHLLKGKNVLYITMEMSEERIAERIDANLLDVTMDDLSVLTKEAYDKKIKRICSKTPGKLIIKEYPTASAGSANFRYLLNELKIKKNFKPDIIYIDYLNICASSRLKYTSNVNTYMYVKAIAEELRGLAVEFDVPIVSATQTTRSGYSSSDVDLGDTSESFGLPATADLMFAIMTNEELAALNQYMVKQLKNRYNDLNFNKRFVIGVDKPKMKLYDVEQSAQEDIMDDKPIFDNSGFGHEDSERGKKKSKFSRDFRDFK